MMQEWEVCPWCNEWISCMGMQVEVIESGLRLHGKCKKCGNPFVKEFDVIRGENRYDIR